MLNVVNLTNLKGRNTLAEPVWKMRVGYQTENSYRRKAPYSKRTCCINLG